MEAPANPPESSIAAERVAPGPASLGFIGCVAVLCIALAAALVGLALNAEPVDSGAEPVDSEEDSDGAGLVDDGDPVESGEDADVGDPGTDAQSVADADSFHVASTDVEAAAALPDGGAWTALVATTGEPAARYVSVGASIFGAAALAFAGRRLLHSDVAALGAALLLALDPAFLQWGHSTLPHATVLALLLGALAALLGARPWTAWTAAVFLSAAAILEPWTVLWSVPLALLLLVRGHIYASGIHLRLALTQTLVLPGLAAGVGLLFFGVPASCLRGAWHEELLLGRVLAFIPGQPAVHNPALWFAGLAAGAALALAALVHAGQQFRLARLPGRVQIRLPEPLPPMQARSLWLVGLVLLVPHPALLWPLLALALAAGVVYLGIDAPGFGIALAFAGLLFGAIFLAQAWPTVTGSGYADLGELLQITPWARVEGC